MRASLLAVLSSFVIDYVARQKVSATSMTYFFVKQFPVLTPEVLERGSAWRRDTPLAVWIAERVAKLACTAVDMLPMARDIMGFDLVNTWQPSERRTLKAELDAAFFHLYGLERNDIDYVMENFPITKRKDIAAFGSYRTKELILEIYDAMQAAIETGGAYRSPIEVAQP